MHNFELLEETDKKKIVRFHKVILITNNSIYTFFALFKLYAPEELGNIISCPFILFFIFFSLVTNFLIRFKNEKMSIAYNLTNASALFFVILGNNMFNWNLDLLGFVKAIGLGTAFSIFYTYIFYRYVKNVNVNP